MLFGTKVLALVAASTSIAFAAPSPAAEAEAFSLVPRSCPRYPSFDGAKEVASLYLGKGNEKSRQTERLIEEIIALLTDHKYKCPKEDIYVWCEDGYQHNSKREADPEPEASNDDNDYKHNKDDKNNKDGKDDNNNKDGKDDKNNKDGNNHKDDKNNKDGNNHKDDKNNKDGNNHKDDKNNKDDKNDKDDKYSKDKYCEKKYPLKSCHVKCKSRNYC